jgi:mRNA interferase RelE/StbE
VNDPYSVQFRPSAAKALEKLDGQIRARILRSITALAGDPRPSGVKSLTGEPGLWRIRVGDYRVVYEIEDDELVVLVVRVAHRSTVYQRR